MTNSNDILGANDNILNNDEGQTGCASCDRSQCPRDIISENQIANMRDREFLSLLISTGPQCFIVNDLVRRMEGSYRYR